MKNKTTPKNVKETRPTVPVREINGEGGGEKVKDVIPDDEESIGQKLVEKGMREPTVTPMADDQRRK